MKIAPPDLNAIQDIEWARLAAYIDGEGCIRIAGVKGSTPLSRRVLYLDVTVANTDLRLCEWLQRTFGGNVQMEANRSRMNANWSNCGKWNVSSRRAADILMRCLPFFIIKREQADLALSFQSTILTDRRYGRAGRPIELIEAQTRMKEQLQVLKGTSSRKRQSASPTIQ